MHFGDEDLLLPSPSPISDDNSLLIVGNALLNINAKLLSKTEGVS
jgi:hypothetical protein